MIMENLISIIPVTDYKVILITIVISKLLYNPTVMLCDVHGLKLVLHICIFIDMYVYFIS